MQPTQWEIITLHPTPVFLSFLGLQLPDIELPEYRSLQDDNTAYAIVKQGTDEETLNEIERHFVTMFRHEITRWLGDNVPFDKIEATFLDFLCCFKFKVHSRVVLVAPSISEGRQVLCIKPRSILLKWMRSAAEGQVDSDLIAVLERVNSFCLAENAIVLVNNFDKLSDIKPFIKRYYQPIFEAEMLRIYDKAEEWPKVDSYQTFSRYFAVETHSQLVHLH